MADALATEHSARMVAMGSARKNAGELVDALTLTAQPPAPGGDHQGDLPRSVGGAEALEVTIREPQASAAG